MIEQGDAEIGLVMKYLDPSVGIGPLDLYEASSNCSILSAAAETRNAKQIFQRMTKMLPLNKYTNKIEFGAAVGYTGIMIRCIEGNAVENLIHLFSLEGNGLVLCKALEQKYFNYNPWKKLIQGDKVEIMKVLLDRWAFEEQKGRFGCMFPFKKEFFNLKMSEECSKLLNHHQYNSFLGHFKGID